MDRIKLQEQFVSISLNAFLLVALMIGLGDKIFLTSIDAAFHYVLVHEIEKFGYVRADVASFPVMAIYPSVSHWLAAIVGWIGGSDVVAMMLIIITSIYAIYFLVDRLLSGGNGISGTIIFATLFVALSATRSQIGWEIVGNYFYPQLVGTVIVFSVLYWLTLNENASSWKQTILILLIVITVTSIQPLSAVHILGACLVFFTFSAFQRWLVGEFNIQLVLSILVTTIVGGLILKFHPTMQAMQQIASNNGALDFGFADSWLRLILPIGALIGCANLLRCLRNRATQTDAVVGSALLALVFITISQYLVLILTGAGSLYAVKKHVFLIVTLSAINLTRMISSKSILRRAPDFSQTAPLLAAFTTTWILYGQGQPSWPIRDMIAKATHAAEFSFPNFIPGNTVIGDTDTTISPIARILISSSAFEYPMNNKAFSWLNGRRAEQDAEYVMLRRTPDVMKSCPERFAESATFAVVRPDCLKNYFVNDVVSFATGGRGLNFLDSGWETSEIWGTWSNGKGKISIKLPPDSRGPFELIGSFLAYLPPRHPAEQVTVKVNGIEIGNWSFDNLSPNWERRAIIPADAVSDGKIEIELLSPKAVSPLQAGMSGDSRTLGIGIRTLQIISSRSDSMPTTR